MRSSTPDLKAFWDVSIRVVLFLLMRSYDSDTDEFDDVEAYIVRLKMNSRRLIGMPGFIHLTLPPIPFAVNITLA